MIKETIKQNEVLNSKNADKYIVLTHETVFFFFS
jgi:hypothetical protein